ncbi:MAG: AmmeMemoRadiSam system protein A [Acidobacteriota bacterium]
MSDLTISEKKELLKLARETIINYMANKKHPEYTNLNEKFNENRGVFVTLHLDGNLRGCIGHPLPVVPLYKSVIENAISSAFEDPRFNSLSEDEVDKIDIEISVLSIPEEMNSYKDVKVGRDGIIISRGFNRGLLLPQVPVEQGWDLEEYISYGCLKAGMDQDQWRKSVKIETFQADVFGEKDLKSE